MPDERPAGKRPTARPRLWIGRIGIVAVLLTGLAAGALGNSVITTIRGGGGGSGTDSGTESDLVAEPGFGVVEETWDVIRAQYVDIEDVPESDLFWGASTGLVDGLGDTGHSRFLDPVQSEAFRASIDGTPIGIGVSIAYLNDYPVIRDVVDGGPADLAGVQRGDVIETIRGDDVSGLESAALGVYFDRVEGHVVDLEIFRPATDQVLDIPVVQRRLDIDTVTWALLPDAVALIRIASFDRGTASDLVQAIAQSRSAGAAAIILDLRDNPGGLVDETVNVMSQFLSAATPVFQTVDAAGVATVSLTSGEGTALATPLTVLVNRQSASAAEIVATSLSEQGRATVIGQTTYGTGTILYGTDLSDGSTVIVGRQRWETPDGVSVWRTGFAPDTEVILPWGVRPFVPEDLSTLTAAQLADTGDIQLTAAIAALQLTATAGSTPEAESGLPASPKASPSVTPRPSASSAGVGEALAIEMSLAAVIR